MGFLHLLDAGSPERTKLLLGDAVGRGDHIHGNGLLYRQLKQDPADAVIAFIQDPFEGRNENFGEIIAFII